VAVEGSKIAAVVPTLGHSPHLAQALQALREQRVAGARIEVFLVTPGERDPELEALCHRVLPAERRLGFAAATNRGLTAAREAGAGLLATVNDDLVVEPGWGEALAEALVEMRTDSPTAPAVAAQGVNLRLDDPQRVDGCGLAWNRAWQAVQLDRGAAPPPADAPCREIFGVSATAALYRAEALAAVARPQGGVFDSRLGSYYEDVELACRLRAGGGKALMVPAARARHAGSTTGRRMSIRRYRWIYGNRLLVLARLLGNRYPRELPRVLARDGRDLLRAVVGLRVARGLGIVAGWGRAVRLLPAYAHRGEALVPHGELERFRVDSVGGAGGAVG